MIQWLSLQRLSALCKIVRRDAIWLFTISTRNIPGLLRLSNPRQTRHNFDTGFFSLKPRPYSLVRVLLGFISREMTNFISELVYFVPCQFIKLV